MEQESRNWRPFLAFGAIMGIILGFMLCFATYGREISYNMNTSINIEQADKFRVFMSRVRDDDTVFMHIESSGGLVMSMNKILYHMNKTKAKIVCDVDSHAYSAAAVIMFSCDEVEIAPNAEISLHVMQICVEYSAVECKKRGPVSKTKDPELYEESMQMLSVAYPYLTDKEKAQLEAGKDVDIKGSDLYSRPAFQHKIKAE